MLISVALLFSTHVEVVTHVLADLGHIKLYRLLIFQGRELRVDSISHQNNDRFGASHFCVYLELLFSSRRQVHNRCQRQSCRQLESRSGFLTESVFTDENMIECSTSHESARLLRSYWYSTIAEVLYLCFSCVACQLLSTVRQ
jgi:hypothetical protein